MLNDERAGEGVEAGLSVEGLSVWRECLQKTQDVRPRKQPLMSNEAFIRTI